MFANRDQDSQVRTKRLIAIPPLRPEFDNFLYAPVGEPTDGMPLSVLSALARQNLDPWEEAAKLTRLSRESAIARLTAMIFTEPGDASPAHSSAANAARLIALLPCIDRFSIPAFGKSPGGRPRYILPIVFYLIVGAILLASALFGN
jgi:hypothetical protein